MKRLLFLLVLSLTHIPIFAQFSIQKVLVDYESEPATIETAPPRFSWQMVADAGQRSLTQKSYSITVWDEGNKTVWQSGKVESDRSLGIAYDGQTLRPNHAYRVQVEVWDQLGRLKSAQSRFQTSLRDTSLAAWSGAKWIGGGPEDLVFMPITYPSIGFPIKSNWTKRANRRKLRLCLVVTIAV